MLKIIFNEKINDAVNNVIYILLLTLNISAIYILISGGGTINAISNSQWFESVAEGYCDTDFHYIDKINIMKALGKYFIIVSVVILAVLIGYIITAHINKWISQLALLHTLGYNAKHMTAYLLIKNAFDIFVIGIMGVVCVEIVWNTLVEKLVFGKLIVLSGINDALEWKTYLICLAVVYVLQMAKGISTYRKVRRKNIKQCLED